MGQAVGTAAALAVRKATSPRGVYESHLSALQQTLLDDDCWLPWQTREIPALTQSASLTADAGDPKPLRSGVDRTVGDDRHAWVGPVGSAITYTFGAQADVRQVRLIFDSDLNRDPHNMPCRHRLNPDWTLPATLVKAFRLEGRDASGSWRELFFTATNHQRLCRIAVNIELSAIRLTPISTWGDDAGCKIFSFDVC